MTLFSTSPHCHLRFTSHRALAVLLGGASLLLAACQEAKEPQPGPQDQQQAQAATDFEGEANPDVMNLQMHTWTWIRTSYNNDTEKTPTKTSAFTLTFSDDGQVQGTTDCNSFRGGVTVKDKQIAFDQNMAMTRKFCEGSREMEFIEMLQNVQSFFFTSRGELIMELKYDSGSMFFK